MSIEKKGDLINFINDECRHYEEPNLTRIFKCFCKCFCKALQDIWKKFESIENLDLHEAMLLGTNMIYHIYWFLIAYANNLKLTIFLTERAILLFTEFIIMSRDPKINKDLYFTPNISDAISFAYKKTIGPIKVSNFISNNSSKINGIKNASSIIKHILQESFFKIINNKNKLRLEDINNSICVTLLNLFVKINDDNLYAFVFDKTILMFDEFNNNLSLTIIFWKLYFDILSDYVHRGRKFRLIIGIMDKAYAEFSRRIIEGKYLVKNDLNLRMIKRMKLYIHFKIYVSDHLRNVKKNYS